MAGDPNAAPPARRSRARRVARAAVWTLLALVLLLVLLLGGAWWWAGTGQSLAVGLAQAARYMPAGQTLQSRDVSGSLRRGGHIGFLRWDSETLSVEVRDLDIAWALPPLLDRQVRLGQLHAASVQIEPHEAAQPQPAEPLQPLDSVTLPVDVELPLRIDRLRWAGDPAVEALALAGRYRYAGERHRLDIDGVDIADGHYSGTLNLQGPAPMAIEAQLDGRVRAPLQQDRGIELLAQLGIDGTLSGEQARLQVEARVDPAEPAAEAPMQGRLSATLAPWQPQPVIAATANLRDIDVSRLLPEAPQTRLSGTVVAGPQAGGTTFADTQWQAEIDLRNALPGPWDRQRLPVESLQARAEFDGSSWRLPAATVRAGGGTIEAQGRWSPAPEPWSLGATLAGVRPGELLTELAGPPVSGTVRAAQQGAAIDFDVALAAQGRTGSAALAGLRLERAIARGQWQAPRLDLQALRLEAAGATVEGQVKANVEARSGGGRLTLDAPGGNARFQGEVAPLDGQGTLALRVDDAARLQAWIQSLPGAGQALGGIGLRGAAQLDASFKGGWQALQRRLQNPGAAAARGGAEPTLSARLSAPRLDLQTAGSAGAPASVIGLRDLRAQLDGSLADARLQLGGTARLDQRTVQLDTLARGGVAGDRRWRATVERLQVQATDTRRPGTWTLRLRDAVTATVRAADGRLAVDASAAAATLEGPVPGTVRIEWEPLQFSQSGSGSERAYRLQSKGRLEELPLAWTEAFGATALAEAGISGDLVFQGRWDIDVGDRLRADVRLARQRGDLRVQAGEAALVTRIVSRGTGTASERTMDAASGTGASTPAGLREAELRILAEGNAVRATLDWDSTRAGRIRANVASRLQQRADGWQWPADAPLDGRIEASLPQLGVWSMLAPPGWRIAGTLAADVRLAGTRSDPRWTGTLAADELALRALVEGLDLRDGRLRARLSGNRLEVTEFTLKGGAASRARIAGQSGNLSTVASEAASDGGTLSAQGVVSWGPAPGGADGGSGIRMSAQARLDQLRLLVRSDRQITVSGQLQARLQDGQFSVRGQLEADRAVIILPEESAPSLGSDVVVHSAARDREAAERAARESARADARAAKAQTAKPPDIQVRFDLGDDFAVQGRGITTRLAGQLDIRSTPSSALPRVTGEIRTVKGQYRAYGQQLDVETGIARFYGPVDNPQLDILAIRPNIAQRVGVRITGTAQSPRVRLYSQPALSDAETLSWLVLGRSSAASGAESLVLQQAALALLGGLGKGGSGGSLASRFGLDEIGFKGPGNGGDVRESAVTVGKRLSKDFYVTYERSLSSALGTLYIFYDLTKRLTLRGQAGQQSGIDLIYTLQYD